MSASVRISILVLAVNPVFLQLLIVVLVLYTVLYYSTILY